MDLQQRFEASVSQKGLFQKDDRLLIAVSGGLDSAVLCRLCQAAGFSFAMAHANFNLRGEESGRDERFVRDLAAGYGVPVHVRTFNTEAYALEKKWSIQEAARELRYAWFRELVEQDPGYDCLLTAHHADDTIETVLMHFFRGTGLRGLTGIPESTAFVRRPLLEFTRAELDAFARTQSLDWVEDSSNRESHYTRNYFRNELIPALETIYPQVRQNLMENVRRFRESAVLYDRAVSDWKHRWCRDKQGEFYIPVRPLLLIGNRALVYELLREYGFGEKQVDEVLKLAASSGGKFIDAPRGPFRIIRYRNWLVVSPRSPVTSAHIPVAPPGPGSSYDLPMPDGILRLKEVATDRITFGPDPNHAFLDMDALAFPLLLRRVKAGDYFYPLGMRKKKKVARFLIDAKLSASRKENIWVLESERRILWILGHRIDDRFRVGPATRRVLHLHWIPSS